ncbi:conserved hypothetical protein [uncultured Desulfobacterium sp.]|uniref:PBS lyase n=1 Tax=uncultured Desulfobacterium sp. TaxID=201089 RepID=A0A445MW50_9BACT|nr:conserved hypothetical protein [uncultured Desulfobacterium sp.]
MFQNKFFGREPVKRPTCPFCSSLIERPKELSTRRQGEMPVGSCSCGAVYSCDETGHNLGSAMIEALVFGCNMDWDLAWGLFPGEDYQQEIVENYDLQTHLIVSSGSYEGRKTSGALYFVRLHKDVLDATAEGIEKRLTKAIHPQETQIRSRGSKKQTLSKAMVEESVKAYQIEPILAAAKKDKKIIRYIQRLLYSGDDLFRRRAADTLGKACALIGETDPSLVSKLLQGLFYSLSDTAAFPLGAFEAIGEIIGHRPDLFGGYAPQIYQFLGDRTRRADALEALARIAKSGPALLRKHTFYFFDFLKDPDARVRGYAALLMGNLGAYEARQDLQTLVDESLEIEIYKEGVIQRKTVGQVASEALTRL